MSFLQSEVIPVMIYHTDFVIKHEHLCLVYSSLRVNVAKIVQVNDSSHINKGVRILASNDRFDYYCLGCGIQVIIE